jgi:hypothetical protein
LKKNEKIEIIINNKEEAIRGSLMEKTVEKLCSKRDRILKIKLSGS